MSQMSHVHRFKRDVKLVLIVAFLSTLFPTQAYLQYEKGVQQVVQDLHRSVGYAAQLSFISYV
jgi:hypothetical protein